MAIRAGPRVDYTRITGKVSCNARTAVMLRFTSKCMSKIWYGPNALHHSDYLARLLTETIANEGER